MHAVVEFIAEFALSIIWWIILFPVVWLVSTPIILLAALFRRKPYRAAVAEMYGTVTDCWKEWGILFVP